MQLLFKPSQSVLLVVLVVSGAESFGLLPLAREAEAAMSAFCRVSPAVSLSDIVEGDFGF